MEIVEIDYAEVLREKQGDAAIADRLIAAALSGPHLELDDSGMRLLLDLVGDPARLNVLMQQLEQRTEESPGSVRVGAFLNILRGLAEYVSRTNPGQLDQTLKQVGQVSGRLSAEAMLELLARRGKPEAMAGTVDVVSAMAHRMSDSAVAGFVSNSVISERGPTDRLAQAFQALVPDTDRQAPAAVAGAVGCRRVRARAGSGLPGLVAEGRGDVTSYSDQQFVSTRTRAR
jgi:hypothetical protein